MNNKLKALLLGALLTFAGFILIYFFGALAGMFMFWSGLIVCAIALGVLVLSGLASLIKQT